jgi:hypothetical protein
VSTTNVPQVNPNAPTDSVTVVNGVPVSTVSGRSATETALQIVLQVDSGPSGLPAQNAPVSITNIPAAQLQSYRCE